MDYLWDIVQIVFADIILSGDNALVIGMAAAGLSPELRKKAIFWGMAMAAGLRIFFAIIASYLISIPGILFVGGLLLSWVCWRFFLEIREQQAEDDAAGEGLDEEDNGSGKSLWSALVTITIADVSMSIDNVFAVAAIAREDTSLLVFGLSSGYRVYGLFCYDHYESYDQISLAVLGWLGVFGLSFFRIVASMAGRLSNCLSGWGAYDGPQVVA